jgi:uracil-DNA glycosylase family 4
MKPESRPNLSRLTDVHHAITSCEKCPRLRNYCTRIAREKKRAYRGDTYWGRPVPGFGDAKASVLILGLAPAAHGANRTGRVFTGDGVGGSGDFLMTALHRNGFANLDTSRHAGDGLQLRGAYIAAAVRCAPPDNKPTPEEIARCLEHLEIEVRCLPNVRVVVALGKIAFDAWLQLLKRRGVRLSPRPAFGHEVVVSFDGAGAGNLPVLVGSFHPSRQNTNTGRLTPEMLANAFRIAKRLANQPAKPA